jgi:hypothetical protein
MELMLDNGGEDWILQGGVEIARDGEESEERQEKRGTPHRRRPPAASSGGGRVNWAEGGNFLGGGGGGLQSRPGGGGGGGGFSCPHLGGALKLGFTFAFMEPSLFLSPHDSTCW